MEEIFTHRVSVSLILTNEQSKILLVRRQPSKEYIGDNYSPINVYLSESDTVFPALIEAAIERLGITISLKDLSFVLCMQIKKEEQNEFVLFVRASRFKGDIVLNPMYYDDSMWCNTELLPLNTEDYIRRAIQCLKKGTTFIVFP